MQIPYLLYNMLLSRDFIQTKSFIMSLKHSLENCIIFTYMGVGIGSLTNFSMSYLF